MNLRLTSTTLFAVALAIASALAITTCAMAQEIDVRATPSITVTGSGETSARPDAVFITLGVETRGKDAAEALSENSTSMQRLFDELERNGIEKKNTQTSNFNISPIYENSRPNPRGGETSQQPRITGYQVTNRVRIKSTKIDQLGTLLDALVREGANSMYGIEFGVSDPQEAKDKATKAAVADAKRKAELLAEAAGVKVGMPIEITESTSQPRPMMRQSRMMMAESSVPVAEGEQEITATVTITYSLMPAE